MRDGPSTQDVDLLQGFAIQAQVPCQAQQFIVGSGGVGRASASCCSSSSSSRATSSSRCSCSRTLALRGRSVSVRGRQGADQGHGARTGCIQWRVTGKGPGRTGALRATGGRTSGSEQLDGAAPMLCWATGLCGGRSHSLPRSRRLPVRCRALAISSSNTPPLRCSSSCRPPLRG